MSRNNAHLSPKIEIRQEIGTNYGEVVGIKNIYPTSPRDKELDILLNKVKKTWIEGVLARSLHNEVLIELNMVDQPEAIEHPWDDILELPEKEAGVMQPDDNVLSVFQDAGNSLLILGAPGSGKTIMLLDLARSLIEKAEHDKSEPVPVILNLSSWATKKLTLDAWMIQEFRIRHHIPGRFSKKWLEENQLIILLDGLDEVPENQRTECVKAINKFLLDKGAPGIVVCSRRNEYESLPTQFQFGGSIHIPDLEIEQIERFIDEAGPQLKPLSKALQRDPELRELAKTPFMVSVMSMVYNGLSSEEIDLISQGGGNFKTRLFNAYIDRVIKRKRRKNAGLASNDLLDRLSYLARMMRQHSKTIFQVEELQMSWLSRKRRSLTYIISSRIIESVLAGVLGGIVGALVLGFTTPANLRGDLIMGVLLGFMFGLVGGGLASIVDGSNILMKPKPVPASVIIIGFVISGGLLASLLHQGVCGPLIGVLPAMDFKWSIVSFCGFLPLKAFLLYSTFFVMTILFLYLMRAGRLLQRKDSNISTFENISTVERLTWSLRRAFKGIAIGAVAGAMYFGPIIGLVAGLLMAVQPNTTDVSFWIWILLGIMGGVFLGILVGGIAGFVFGGLKGSSIEKGTKVNQGILLSIRNALLAGFSFKLVALMIGVAITASIWILSPYESWGPFILVPKVLQQAPFSGLILGLICFMVAFLFYGGQDAMRHYFLRVILKTRGLLPLRLTPFLDHATKLMLLHKVGGGYIFIHRMLLDHFADRYEEKK